MTAPLTALTLTLDGATGVVVTRRFAAAPERIWDAHVDPEMVRRWCLGPDGWTMPVCEIDARPGGGFRYVWADGTGASFSITGSFHVLERPGRIVHVEVMHLPDPTPENHVETLFAPDGAGGTLMTMRMTLPSAEAREAMLASGMESGMADSYVRLDGLAA